MLRHLAWLASAVCITCVTHPAYAAPPKYTVANLFLPGWQRVYANDLNNRGQVVGDLCSEHSSCWEGAFLYENKIFTRISPETFYGTAQDVNEKGDVLVELDGELYDGSYVFSDGTLQKIANDEITEVFGLAINDSKQVLGTGLNQTVGEWQTFIWHNGAFAIVPKGPFSDLGGSALNNAGQVAGNGYFSDSEPASVFLFTNNQTVSLGSIPGATSSYPFALNDSGVLVGIAQFPDDSARGFISRNGGLLDLGTLGGTESYAYAINDSGRVVGFSSLSNGARRAFLSDGTTMTNLGVVSGDNSSAAYDISNNGQIVGISEYLNPGPGAGTRRGFVTGFGAPTLYDLNTLIHSSSPNRDKISIHSAERVNEFGQILASGYFEVNPGVWKFRTFLLTPVDSTAPIVKPILTGVKGLAGWFKSDVSLTWSTTDAEAPIGSKTDCISASVVNDTKRATYKCVAKSIGGTTSKSVSIKRDTVVPTTQVNSPASGAVFNRNQKVIADYWCSDATSGIKSCVGTKVYGARIDTSKKVTNATFKVTAIDKAGHKTIQTVTYSVK